MVDRLLGQLRDLQDEVETAPESNYREGYLDAIDYVIALIAEEYE